MKKTILIILVLAAVVGGCKKYEEGPLISFRSAKNRLYGKYELRTYTINGVDSVSLFYDSLAKSFEFYYDEIYELNVCAISGYRKDGNLVIMGLHWNFIDNNTILKMAYHHGPLGTGPFGHNITNDWKILRLTSKEVKMKTTYNNKEYQIELKQ